MLKKAFVAAAFLALPFAAFAQNSGQLIERYTALAGSKENAASLVSGLRDGSEVRLTSAQSTETFTPSTGKMGNGNIDHALSLTEASLKQQGITNPTPAQLEAALQDVLQKRASGMGWGQIANSMGFKLGEIKRAERADRAVKAERPARPEKPEKPARPERPERHK